MDTQVGEKEYFSFSDLQEKALIGFILIVLFLLK